MGRPGLAAPLREGDDERTAVALKRVGKRTSTLACWAGGVDAGPALSGGRRGCPAGRVSCHPNVRMTSFHVFVIGDSSRAV